jgi:histone H3/H4
MKSKLIIPYAPVEREIKTNTSLRVSAEATSAVTEKMISFGKKISERASEIAKHAGRKTIRPEDVRLAYDDLKK